MNIISLLPSATEIICALGLRDQLVGVTHECDYPSGVDRLAKVTQTLIPHDATSGEIDTMVRERLQTERALYSLNMPVVESLAPDLIVTQALCDVCAVAESEVNAAACSLPGKPRVVNLEPTSLSEMFDCITLVGEAASCPDRAATLIEQLKSRVARVRKCSEDWLARPGAKVPSVMLLEWIDPPFSAGHWSPELVRLAGGNECVGEAGERSVTTSWERIREADPDVLFIACCGFSVSRTLEDVPILCGYPGWSDMKCVREDRVYVVDGSAYFSRPGPRLIDSLEILANTLHPEIHPLSDGLPSATHLKKVSGTFLGE
ncbi:periplasmic binding protein [Rhodopirellula baltica SH28]|uniref:Periplasmic binding protein n=1 Tax=Rhodopirellula baltica SH28 TaxID=993517 RepID=K5DKN6_RHOBT|nr:cobalamin-binding protein [Rhodopirellula baltica]EKK03038.1 periplasmic binding protein [Rhodopirellula baltica SH28]